MLLPIFAPSFERYTRGSLQGPSSVPAFICEGANSRGKYVARACCGRNLPRVYQFETKELNSEADVLLGTYVYAENRWCRRRGFAPGARQCGSKLPVCTALILSVDHVIRFKYFSIPSVQECKNYSAVIETGAT